MNAVCARSMMKVNIMADVLVLSAHPDDAELSAGGTIKKLTNEGLQVVLVDCSAGELGTRGTPQLRQQEAEQAAHILGVTDRRCLHMPDGNITHIPEYVARVVDVIREFQPKLLVTTPPFERHPDHEAVHKLARAAAFLAGLPRFETATDEQHVVHRPSRIMCYQQQYDFQKPPDVYVDISNTWQDKLDAILAYSSQFHVPERYVSNEPETFLSRPDFLAELEAKCRFWGSRIGVAYAEAFMTIEPLGVRSLSAFL